VGAPGAGRVEGGARGSAPGRHISPGEVEWREERERSREVGGKEDSGRVRGEGGGGGGREGREGGRAGGAAGRRPGGEGGGYVCVWEGPFVLCVGICFGCFPCFIHV
jgi:hypothetical protein